MDKWTSGIYMQDGLDEDWWAWRGPNDEKAVKYWCQAGDDTL